MGILEVAFDFTVLLLWILVSCTTLPVIQWWVRRLESASIASPTSSTKCRDSKEALRLGVGVLVTD